MAHPSRKPLSPLRTHRSHYSPRLDRRLVCALYHEARRRKQPMTRLTDELLAAALRGTTGLRIAEERFPGPSRFKRSG